MALGLYRWHTGEETLKLSRKSILQGGEWLSEKSFFKEYGGFNVDLQMPGNEKYIFDKLKSDNLKIIYVPELEVEHFIDDTTS